MHRLLFLLIFYLLCPLLAKAEDWRLPRIKGDSCVRICEYEKAIAYYQQLNDKISTAYRDKRLRIAFCYKEMGEFGKADSIYVELIKDGRWSNIAKIKLANVYDLQGRYDDALRLLMSTTMLKDTTDEKDRILTLGNTYLYLGRNEEAIALYDSVMYYNTKSNPSYPVACNGIANIALQEGKYELATKTFKQAVGCYDNDSPRRYQVLGNLALAEGLSGNTAEGLQQIDEALTWQAEHLGKQHHDYIKCLNKKAQIQMFAGLKKEAANTYKEYFQLERDNILRYFSTMTEKERLAYWKSQKESIAKCYTLEEESPQLLYEVALFSKTILLLSNCNFRQVVSKDEATDSLYLKLQQLRRKQKAITDKDEFSKIEDEAEAMEKSLISQCDMYAKFENSIKTSPAEIQRALKNRNDVAIEFINYKKGNEQKYAALVLKKDGSITFCLLFNDEFLQQKVKGKLTLVNVVEGYSYSAIDKLYTDTAIAGPIWNPILQVIPKTGKIYFAPDGILSKIAIEYMCDSLSNGRNSKDIFRLSSTRTLLQNNEDARGKVLLVGSVDFDDMSKMGTQENADRITAELLRRDGMPPANGNPYNYLFASAGETDSIKSRLTGYDISTLTKANATEDSLKAVLGNYNVVHIATHGYTYQEKDDQATSMDMDSLADLSVYRSGLILAGANKASSTSVVGKEDGILSASEISELHLEGLKLIVLSACQTALGNNTSDEGPVGLVRGLKKAGVRQIVASLWEVSDEATLKLMTYFYEAIAQGKSPHSALIMAQEKLRNTDKSEDIRVFDKQKKRYISKGTKVEKVYNRPCYWAPFIIIDSLN